MKRLWAQNVLAGEVDRGEIVAHQEGVEIVTAHARRLRRGIARPARRDVARELAVLAQVALVLQHQPAARDGDARPDLAAEAADRLERALLGELDGRSEEHTSELQSHSFI